MQGTLPIPEPDAPKTRGGPVYQGVCKTIRHLADQRGPGRRKGQPAHPDRLMWEAEHAGLIASARSLAESIDLANGYAGHKVQGGMQVAALHAQLVDVLELLAPRSSGGGVLETLAERFQELEESERASRATPPHAAQ